MICYAWQCRHYNKMPYLDSENPHIENCQYPFSVDLDFNASCSKFEIKEECNSL